MTFIGSDLVIKYGADRQYAISATASGTSGIGVVSGETYFTGQLVEFDGAWSGTIATTPSATGIVLDAGAPAALTSGTSYIEHNIESGLTLYSSNFTWKKKNFNSKPNSPGAYVGVETESIAGDNPVLTVKGVSRKQLDFHGLQDYSNSGSPFFLSDDLLTQGSGVNCTIDNLSMSRSSKHFGDLVSNETTNLSTGSTYVGYVINYDLVVVEDL